MQPVWHLGRGPERESSVGPDLGSAAVGLHRYDRHALVDVAPAHHDVGDRQIGSRLVDDHHRLVRPVFDEDRLGADGERVLGVDVRGEFGDVGPHHPCGILALLERLGEHHGDRFADESHLAVGQWRATEVLMDDGEPVMRRDTECVGREDLHDARHPRSVLDVDRADRAVSHVGAHEDGVQPIGEIEIGEVRAAAGEQTWVLGSQHASAEDRARPIDRWCRRGIDHVGRT